MDNIIPKNYINQSLHIINSYDSIDRNMKELDYKYNEDKINLYKILVKSSEIYENLKNK